LQLGRYQILKQLATGDVADVWLARASGLEGFTRHVVIKRIRPELACEERLVEAFLAEARIAGALHHQNVVQVHDVGQQDGAYFFAMEYVHGDDVRGLLARVRERDEQVPLGHAIAIVTATAAGLHHAHEQRGPTGEPLGLVHRDVCPANILLGYDGSVKLVDFGMARAALGSTKTASGALKLKASYMSPEQCCGKTVDRRTDTFALGIVLYELVTARRLFKAANEYLTMAAIVEGEVPPPSRFRAELPPSIDEIVLRALAKAPEARYQTAEDLRAALERFALDQQLRTSNKALADYFAARFGPRLEPWHELTDPGPPPGPRDDSQGKGLVAAPEADSELIARHAVRSTSPIMLAQTLAVAPAAAGESATPAAAGTAESVDDGWGDDEVVTSAPPPPALPAPIRDTDHEETRNEKPPSAVVAVPAPPRLPEEAEGATVVAPPLFVDAEAPIQQDDLPPHVAAAAAVAPAVDTITRTGETITEVDPTSEDDDDNARTLDGTSTRRTGSATPARGATLTGVGLDEPLPPRASSEHMYIGPPAPPPSRAIAQTFFGTYRRSILVGATAGLVTLIVAGLALRSCASHAATPPAAPAATGSTSSR
jgi:serine/threonine protein kinase